MIEINGLYRSYNKIEVHKNISLTFEPGTFTAVLGRNGSGKSTLARHINAILKPQKGSVKVDGMDTHDNNLIYDIRETAGMVFQNPESQAVASIVEDDTAFAPENLGLSDSEILERVESALRDADIEHLRYKPISTLSGGQKQLTAIAGILAMRPRYMIFDEGTSMLDPISRKRVMDCVKRLKKDLNLAIIWITHYMDEAALADRVIIMNDGEIMADGTPENIFSDIELIENSGLELPQPAKLCVRLRNAGFNIPIVLNAEDCAREIYRLASDCTEAVQ